MTRKTIVVGAGITGTCLARELSARGVEVTVVERDGAQPRGSTAFAPGFVGLYNDAPVLTGLARASAAVYDGAAAGFERRGGLELATSGVGAVEVRRRVAAARAAGLPAEVLTDLPRSVARFVDVDQVIAAGHFPDDGVADPVVLTAALRTSAQVVTGAVVAIESSAAGVVVRLRDGSELRADDVVLAGGVWGPQLAAMTGIDLPLFPVAHPYVYAAATRDLQPGPFVRWPEHHVYARVHGDRLGTGSYDHAPVPVEHVQLDAGAGLPWRADFEDVVRHAQRLLAPASRTAPERRVNGVFAMTPDNLPFLGPHPHLAGVWIAQALWVTHAAGAAGLLAAAIDEGAALPSEVAVDRHAGSQHDDLRRAALRLYRDIYAHEAA